MNPSARSLKWLREQGYIVQGTEATVRIPDKALPSGWRMFRRDLFNFCDMLAVKPDVFGATFVQVTAGMNNKGGRIAKIEAAPASHAILRSGNTIELHIWRKMGARGKVKHWKLARFQARLCPTGLAQLSWIEVDSSDPDFDVPEPKQLDLLEAV